MTLADPERGLLDRLLAAQEVDRAPFWIVRELGSDPTLSHPGLPDDEAADEGALLRLEASGLLLSASRYLGFLQSFYLASDARERLAAANLVAGAPDPLEGARAEIERLEGVIRGRDARRRRSAERFGRFVRWIVLPAALLLVAAIAWATVGPLAGVGTVIALGIVYAVLTTGLGITGLQATKAAEDAATRWAERRLARWTDPDAP